MSRRFIYTRNNIVESSSLTLTFIVVAGGQTIGDYNSTGGRGGFVSGGTFEINSGDNISVTVGAAQSQSSFGSIIANGYGATESQNGTYSTISGSAYYYGGAGGHGWTYPSGLNTAGGLTGGGNGALNNGYGSNGTGYGAGGGGGFIGYSTVKHGGTGYRGVVIIRYTAASQLCTGGTVTTSGGDYIHTFNTAGNFTFSY